MRRFADQAGVAKNFTVLDQSDTEDLIDLLRRQIKLTKDRHFPRKRTIAAVFSMMVNKVQSLKQVLNQQYPQFVDERHNLETLFKSFEDFKRSRHMLTYDDLLVRLREALETSAATREQLSEQYRYIMVDEYQDTNKLQAQIVKLMTARHENVAVVGDEFQSIYSFRGASHRNMLEFPKLFPKAQIIKLEENFRSTQPILDVANAIILCAVLSLPIAVGIAILRYRLYDIDLLINRTLVYGALTLTLALAYGASIVLLQQLSRPLTAGSDLAVAGSTLAVAALFQPVRRRIQSAVDRRFYRSKYDAERTIARFAARLRAEVDLEALQGELGAVVRDVPIDARYGRERSGLRLTSAVATYENEITTPTTSQMTMRRRWARRSSICPHRLARASASEARVVKVSKIGRSSTSVFRNRMLLPIRRKGKAIMLKINRNGNVMTRQSALKNLFIFLRVGIDGFGGGWLAWSRTRCFIG